MIALKLHIAIASYSCTASSLNTNLKHILIKNILIIFSELLEDNCTELWEVDVTVPDDVVGQVDDLLLHGVEAQHLHGRVQILQVS